MFYLFIKRAFDIICSLFAMLLLLPFFIVIAIIIKCDSKGPVFYKQERLTKDGKHFYIHKFRSMRVDAEKDGVARLSTGDQDDRITRVGHVIRKIRVDELPQLLNILAGDMSVIGPRPALWNQEDLFQERERYGANDVRPGLTGWAQIHGGDELEIPEKARLDGEYAQNISFGMDMKIFWMTVKNVLRGSGVVEGGPKEMKKESKS